MSYVYIRTEKWTDDDGISRELWTVGFYDPAGKFQTDSDHGEREEAAKRVHYLNGGAA